MASGEPKTTIMPWHPIATAPDHAVVLRGTEAGEYCFAFPYGRGWMDRDTGLLVRFAPVEWRFIVEEQDT